MKKKLLYDLADELFWWFEDNIFINSGPYPRDTNLVFAFAEYIKNLPDCDLMEHLGFKEEITLFRQLIEEGINNWLCYNIKTMFIM